MLNNNEKKLAFDIIKIIGNKQINKAIEIIDYTKGLIFDSSSININESEKIIREILSDSG